VFPSPSTWKIPHDGGEGERDRVPRSEEEVRRGWGRRKRRRRKGGREGGGYGKGAGGTDGDYIHL